jgi:hypothetical protein
VRVVSAGVAQLDATEPGGTGEEVE